MRNSITVDDRLLEIKDLAEHGSIIVVPPNMAIQIELEEALNAIFIKHGLNPVNHMWGI